MYIQCNAANIEGSKVNYYSCAYSQFNFCRSCHIYQLWGGKSSHIVWGCITLKDPFSSVYHHSSPPSPVSLQVEGVSVTWATGYMLNQSKSIPDDPNHVVRPYSAVDLIVGILVLTILCSVFVLFFLLTFNACRKVLKSHAGYSQISWCTHTHTPLFCEMFPVFAVYVILCE